MKSIRMMWKTFFNWWDPLGEFGFWVGCSTPTLHEFALVAQRHSAALLVWSEQFVCVL